MYVKKANLSPTVLQSFDGGKRKTMRVVYICTVSVWLIGRRARWPPGFDVGVGGGVGGDRASFQAVTGKGKQAAF